MAAEQYGWLHIYAQPCEHFPARIVGDRLGLETLADALKHALKYDNAESRSLFPEDGEGYSVEVERVETVTGQPLPYYSHHAEAEIQEWRERAFLAEAEVAKLKKVAAGTKEQQ